MATESTAERLERWAHEQDVEAARLAAKGNQHAAGIARGLATMHRRRAVEARAA